MDLYLVRHGIAFDQDAERWPDDSRRPLSPEGEERFRQAARGLGTLVPSVDVHLASTFVRAWRTAELLTEEAGWPKPEPAPELESGTDPKRMLALLARVATGGSVAMVGHEPDLSELVSYLLTGSMSRVLVEMKKGSVACLGLDGGAAPGSASLRWLLTPKALRGLGG
jgi:phosphohistidine phosphatase